MKKFLSRCAAIAACALLFCCGGCGYSVGSLAHPQLATVAVGPVVNNTLSYNAAAQLRSLLCECFMSDGSLKLVDMREADCIVYATVTSVTYKEQDWSSIKESGDNYQPNQWSVTANIDYTVVMPGRAKPLLKSSATGSADFLSGPDIENARQNGLRQAMYNASKSVVSGLTEGW